MDAKNQFICFCICLAVGFAGGFIYSACSFVRTLFSCQRGKNKAVGAIADVAFFLAFALLTVAAAYAFRFPSFRVYMWAGYGLGLILYLKSLHKVVAFFQNVCYNKVTKVIEKARKRRKTLKKRVKENGAG